MFGQAGIMLIQICIMKSQLDIVLGQVRLRLNTVFILLRYVCFRSAQKCTMLVEFAWGWVKLTLCGVKIASDLIYLAWILPYVIHIWWFCFIEVWCSMSVLNVWVNITYCIILLLNPTINNVNLWRLLYHLLVFYQPNIRTKQLNGELYIAEGFISWTQH